MQLLCQYERNSVLKFLETFESYRVEHCLRLCQEYGIIDAAAFLLERVGDVGSALLLTLSGINDKFITLDTAVVNVLANDKIVVIDTVLRMKEVRQAAFELKITKLYCNGCISNLSSSHFSLVGD